MQELDHGRLIKVLVSRFAEAKARNPQFSVRSFAGRLSISHSALSEIMNGKRGVSKKMAGRLCDALNLEPQETERILTGRRRGQGAKSKPEIELTHDQFKVVSQWQHFAILNLLSLHGENQSPKSLSRRLGISEETVTQVLDRLQRLSLIKQEKGVWKRTHQSLKTSDDVAQLSIRAHHLGLLELAGKKLMELAPVQRDFTSVTIPANPKKLAEAKKLVREFHDELGSILEEGEQTEVFVLSMQLYPITNERG